MQKNYKKLYADIIYPAIYQRRYEEPVQLDIDTFDKDELDTSSDMLDKSNRYARDKGKFKVGNKMGVRFAHKERQDEPKQQNMKLSDIKS
jgi:hypothetical protein